MGIIVAKKNPLFDKEFLEKLFSFKHREIYAKIILLTMKEEPLEQIEGKITDGSINIDGSSAVRRTCNLTMVAEDINITEFYWGLKNKFKLEIGIKNTINENYPEIIWFKQGIFVITQFNTSQDTKKCTIKIQGRDKMCLLNGDLSGQLPPGDFAVEQYLDESGNITEKKIPIKTIILKLLQEFALELPHNIIINDIDESGYDLLEYRGEEPFYLFKNILSEEIDNMSPDNELECYYQLKEILTQDEYDLIPEKYDFLKSIYIRDNQNLYHFNELLAIENKNYLERIKDSNWFKGVITDIFNITYDNLLDNNEFEGDKISTKIRFAKGDQLTKDIYSVIKIDYGDIPGYRATELTFAGELKSNAGETITSILDKIKNKFTNFEYYYDIDGKFIFQKKKEYLLTPWNSVETEENNGLYTNAMINNSQTLFTFTDSQLITAVQNTPNLQNLKNDYSVHGNRDNLALRMRYAIDQKPTTYTPIRVLKEKIVTIKRRASDAKIIDEQIEYKYYDAPEQEPYNDIGLLATDQSYQIIELLDKKINHLTNSKVTFNLSEFKKIEEVLNINLIGEENYNWILSLFSQKDSKNLRTWLGTFEDLKKIITILNDANTYYENPVKMSFISTEDGYEIQTIIYPYFAKYPYSTSHVVLIKDEKTKIEQILYKDKIEEEDNVVHYKVDWRELIYQMGLDYRKLNTTNNYYYYLASCNDFVSYNKTGYEQYYVDLISNWRDLYDPNPQLQYDGSIKFNEIKKQSLLLDDDNTNDVLDNIYISNGYSLINKDTNQDTLNYNNVYKFSHPIDSEINSIYPFYQSTSHFLDKENNNYYLEDETTKKVRNIINTEKDDTIVYETLKNVSPERIYIKNDKDFTTLSYQELEIELTKDTYKPYTYFVATGEYQAVALPAKFNFLNAIDEKYYEKYNDNYILTKDQTAMANKIYYRAIYSISAEYDATQTYFNLQPRRNNSEDFNSFISNSVDSNGTDFKVLQYPATTNLDSEYEQAASSDYMIYAQVNFQKQLEEGLITGTDKDKNLNFYIQNSNYVKLSNTDSLWDLYYRSTLYPLAYKTSEILYELEEIVQNCLNYEQKTIAYIDSVNNVFKKYFLFLNSYNYIDINNFVFVTIQELYEQYSNGIKTLAENGISGKFNLESDSISCLYYIYSLLLEEYNKIEFNIESSSSTIESLFHINNVINNLNVCIQKILRNIEVNYNQVKFITEDDTINRILSLEKEVECDKYRANSIIELQSRLNLHIKTLGELTQLYSNGQAQKTKDQLIEIVNYIEGNIPQIIFDDNNNLKVDDDGNFYITKIENNQIILDTDKTNDASEKIQTLYEELVGTKENRGGIINTQIIGWIKELDTQKNEINNFVFHSFVWTPNLIIENEDGTTKYFKDLEKKEQEILIDAVKQNHLLYKSFMFLKNIKNIFIKDKNGYKHEVDAINNLLTYNDFKLFEDFQNDLINAKDKPNLINLILTEFEDSTKDFQEYIILEDVNNFNQINSNKIYYLPIHYNKSYYNYNTNKEEGNYWYKDIFDNPQLLTFWFDFLEPFSTEMAKYAVSAIGMRSKVISDQEVKAVHYADIPAVIFQDPDNSIDSNMSGYTQINLTSGFMNLFTISTKGKTAKERIEELLYNHSYCSENINIQTIPIYNLEPNNKIYIQDEKCNINGEYLVNKITIPLSFKKMMSISATKSISSVI